MGFQLSSLVKDRHELFVPATDKRPDEITPEDLAKMKADGQGVNVVYNPQSYTVALEERIAEISLSEFQSSAVIVSLAGLHEGDPGFEGTPSSGMLLEWDLMNDDKPIPISHAGLRIVPLAFLLRILDAIERDVKPTADEGKPSAGGSAREGSLVSLPAGIGS